MVFTRMLRAAARAFRRDGESRGGSVLPDPFPKGGPSQSNDLPSSMRGDFRPFVTSREASGLFREIADDPLYCWEFTATGCIERAQLICRMLALRRITCAKFFVFSGKRLGLSSHELRSPKPPMAGPYVTWPIHAAPFVQVGAEQRATVLDPAVADEPLLLDDWLTRLGDPTAKWAQIEWFVRQPESFGLNESGQLVFSRYIHDHDGKKSLEFLRELREMVQKAQGGHIIIE